ncbi:bifunctional hydroxymethylpyrimidine kinase/phosphomethylpyrimidine kinase [Ottowia thiooxydans]|uniref:bifunctional hydroxymethylpyrimidine kinase/phosphomethylpyrimidine kinase n=1 Tax=Ottowia thiooxydans TaxID=219182 RepID=UPI00040C166A|nr:bifunctional hydroxymethylpyrimidine kinase/phosphomethylpyrimidine kinase [Ottowia thiooxydans]
MSGSLKYQYVRVLTIAGSDSGGGAGIQADLKTMAALGCFGMSAITALTAQNTQGVTAIHSAPAEFLTQQIDAVMGDIGAHAVKIGMLHSVEIVGAVARAIDRHALPHVVLDPVMVSANGAQLIETPAVQALVRELFPRAAIITPNVDEAALLLGKPIKEVADLTPAALALLGLGAHAVLLKGGHLAGEEVHDLLVMPGNSNEPVLHEMRAKRIHSHNLHGAGCTLSSAIASHMALGLPLMQAVEAGLDYVRQALISGADVKTGEGVGPLNHGFAPSPLQKRPG